MRLCSSISILVGALLLLVLPQAARGQGSFGSGREPGFMIDANLGYVLISGEIGDSLKGGPGVEAAGLYQIENLPLRIGAGAGYTRHGLQDPAENMSVDGSAGRLSLFALAGLLLLNQDTEMVAYLQGRLGWTRLSIDANGAESSRSGPEFGALAGIDIPLSDKVSLDFSGMFQWISGGDASVNGVAIPGTSRSGSAFSLRGGVILSL